jgi:Lipocalin-like domain
MLLSRRVFTVLALLASGAAFSSCGSQSQDEFTARDRIVGSWELQSRTVQRAGGEVVNDPVLGERPIGRLFYSSSGHVALQMMRQGRAQAITEPPAPADSANARIVLGYDAYFGTFTVDEAAGTVTHHVQGSLFPEDLGKDFVRRFRVDSDAFELSFASPSADGASITRTLVFRRSH